MKQKPLFKSHPISLEWVVPKQLSIEANVPPTQRVGIDSINYSLAVGHSEYDKKEKAIEVALKLETIQDQDKDKQLPYLLKIELIALFRVDEDEFEIKNIEDWARRNAPFILYPYLREHAYALTLRCGFEPLMLPLVEVPTAKAQPRKKTKRSTKTSQKKT